MKAIAAAILVFILMVIFTKPIVRMLGGSVKVWVLLILDIVVAILTYILVV